MERRIRAATAVVCHGGPATITLALQVGKRPIVVPRRQALGEHVDDHQADFSRRLSAEGEIDLAETEESFRQFLDTAILHGRPVKRADRRRSIRATVRRFEELVDEMLGVADHQSPYESRSRERAS
jgi:UDP-N-acetylglucosamine transferase subunit ALG13